VKTLENDTLSRYLGVVKRWWWLLILGIAIPAGVSWYFISRQPSLYQATATLMVGTAIRSTNPDPNVVMMSDTLAQAYAAMVTRRPLAEAVLKKLGLKMSPEDLAQFVTTRIRPEAQLLEITVTLFDPRWAAEIANALANELVQQSPGARLDIAQREFSRSQLADLQDNITKVRADLDKQQADLANMNSAAEIADAEDRIAALERVLATYQSTYASLLQSVTSEQGANILSVVDPAYAPSAPMARRDVLIISLAALSGLVFAFSGALVIEFLDDRLHWEGPGQESLLGLPVLGAIQQMSVNGDPLVLRARPGSREAEAIRGVRTGVLLQLAHHPSKVLLFVSPSPREGKSLVAANLAAAFAILGRRTILVDADLRKRDLHKLLQLPKGPGIVEWIDSGDESDLLALVQQTPVPNLSFLRAGSPSMDPTALLSSTRFMALLETLKENFDLIILDSPAILAVPDAEILATLADRALLLVDAETTSRRMATKAKNALQGQDRILGIVFNRARFGRRDYYQYYR
jgi:polysaccharide biosynthesis transport protein